MMSRGYHSKLCSLLFLMATTTTTCMRSTTAATVHVAPTGGGQDIPNCGDVSSPCASLQYAISNRALPGDTVVAMPGVHRGPFGPPGDLGGGIELAGRNITVTGRGGAVVDCQGSGRGFQIKDSGRPAVPPTHNASPCVAGYPLTVPFTLAAPGLKTLR